MKSDALSEAAETPIRVIVLPSGRVTRALPPLSAMVSSPNPVAPEALTLMNSKADAPPKSVMVTACAPAAAPMTKRSVSAPPVSTSWLPEEVRVSLPSPPSRVFSPPPLRRSSAPPEPEIESSAAPPMIVSSLF